jgi:hypothetical protein
MLVLQKPCGEFYKFLWMNNHTLFVHLPFEQTVYFKPGSEEDVLLRARNSDSTLLPWFELNQIDIIANQYLYHNIPNYYTFYN